MASAGAWRRKVTMGEQALRAGDPRRAATLADEVLVSFPHAVPAHRLRAHAMIQLGRPLEAMAHLRRVVELTPGDAVTRMELGQLLREEARPDEAIEHFLEAARIDAKSPAPALALAALYEQTNDLDRAEQWASSALTRDPASSAAPLLAALIEFRRATTGQEKPTPDALEALAERVRRAIQRTSDPAYASQGWSLLADIEERLGNDAGAFDAMTRMNRALRPLVPYSGEQQRAYLDTIGTVVRGLTPEMASRWGDPLPPDSGPAPIFLMGFPRSGTTMVERALDAHPRVRSLEERRTLQDVKRAIAEMLEIQPGVRPSPDILDRLSPAQVGTLRRIYWETIEAEMDGAPMDPGVFLLDKSPLRTVDLPFVNRVFPDARVLFALRDPRDVCLSCFRQNLSVGLNASFFLDLGDTARLYGAVMDAWLSTRDAYSVPWREVRYEETVADFPGAMRAMLEFLGLAWDDAVLEFHTTTRATWTVNQWAIRDKVNTRAVGRWKRYEPQLAPILAPLAPYVEAFGYET